MGKQLDCQHNSQNKIFSMLSSSKNPFGLPFVFLPSSRSGEGKVLIGVPNHPNWLIFSRNLMSNNDFPRVITYVNIRLALF